MNRFPEIHDLAAVTIEQVDYYGYIEDIDFDMRHPRIYLCFHPRYYEWFDMSEVKIVEYPVEKK